MNTKQRDAILQRWTGAIRRESRDMASLEQTAARALADPDVRDDQTLQSMIQADVAYRRNQLEQELQSAQRAALSSPSATSPASPSSQAETRQPEEIRATFKRMVLALSESLARSDEEETRILLGSMRVLQAEHPAVIPASLLVEYERGVEQLRARLHDLREELKTLGPQAVTAARKGSSEDLAQVMRRLTAIHAAHPAVLDESAFEAIRVDAVRAADEGRQTRAASVKLVERSRTIAAELKALADAVREFHRVGCTLPPTSSAFREAEAKYLRTIQQVRSYDSEWFSGVVLELADLLSEWTLPPLGVEDQIDRFLDRIGLNLDKIRAEMREIETEQEE